MRKFKQINASITALIASAEKMQQRILELATECLQHAQAHGDVTLIERLVTELPKGQRAKALGVWVGTYFPVKGNADGWSLKRGWDKNPDLWRFEEALADPYWNPAEDKMFKADLSQFTFDQIVNAALNSKLNRLEKAKEESFAGNYDESIDDIQATIDALKAQAAAKGYMTEVTTH